MTSPSEEERLAVWQAEEAAIRSRMAEPGTLSLAEVSRLAPKDFFDGIGRGELPAVPMGALLGFVPIEYSEGHFVFQGTPDERHFNPLGSVHGGYAATLLDSCLGCAIHTALKPGQAYTTTDLRVSYIRALRGDVGPVRAEGRLIHLGRSTALAEGRIYDVHDRLYAVGSATCLILTMPGNF